jgi:Cu(I)/Ag(I) efflux system protein CusF
MVTGGACQAGRGQHELIRVEAAAVRVRHTARFFVSAIGMKTLLMIVAALGCALAAPVGAQTAAPKAHGSTAAQPAATSEVYDGQVRRINRDRASVTLAHGPLKAFNMDAMTMSFRVKDAAQLAKLKEGDKVRFSLQQSGDDLVVTRIEAVK